MKQIMKFWNVAWMLIAISAQPVLAQKFDEERMNRDIEVAENVLSTLIKQEINQQRGMWPVEIKGSYLPGYGVTFRLPGDFATPFMLSIPGGPDNLVTFDRRADGYSYTITAPDQEELEENDEEDNAVRLKERSKQKRRMDRDSLRDSYNLKVIKAAKDFILDYGDFISQLGPNEKIVITNQGEGNRGFGVYFKMGKRTHLSVEATRADIISFKQGKSSRDQALAKIKVINTESTEVKEPDMELLSSIFSRLYRSDLSKTYFTEDNIYYERLKDYGVIYYMHVYSSNETDFKRYDMPTVDLDNVDQATRDKKVAELYPKFEQDIRENMLEYGRTLKTLQPDENLIFNISLTKCKGCNIPSTLELSVKGSVLQDYGAGKVDKTSAISRFVVKKGPNQ